MCVCNMCSTTGDDNLNFCALFLLPLDNFIANENGHYDEVVALHAFSCEPPCNTDLRGADRGRSYRMSTFADKSLFLLCCVLACADTSNFAPEVFVPSR